MAVVLSTKKPVKIDQPVRYSNDIFSISTSGVTSGDTNTGADLGFSVGGNDKFTVTKAGLAVTVYGETSGTMKQGAIGGNDSFFGGNDGYSTFYGDAYHMTDAKTLGGNDSFQGSNAVDGYAVNEAYGDAGDMTTNAMGGNDNLHGGDAKMAFLPTALGPSSGYEGVWNMLAGDAHDMTNATGGRDNIHGGDGISGFAFNQMTGDAVNMYEGSIGGNDNLVGGHTDGYNGFTVNFMTGDAINMYGGSSGGDDNLVGGDGYTYNLLAGDAEYVVGNASEGDGYATIHFGNDKLHAGNSYNGYGLSDYQNLLVGDADHVDGYATGQGGNDKLYSGTGNDEMWGDFRYVDGYADMTGGADTFYFSINNGHDMIGDFNAEEGDTIDLTAFNLSGLLSGTSYASVEDWLDDMATVDGDGDAVLDFSLSDIDIGGGSIDLVGLSAADLDALIHNGGIVY